MVIFQSQFFHLTCSAITLVVIFGALLMIWPAFFALFLTTLLLLQSCCAELKVMMLSWTEVGHAPIVVSLRRPGLSNMLL